MLVSAVMPTRGRAEFAAKALECFLSQTWSEKELVILDDADCRSFDKPPELPNVRYSLANTRLNIAQKRNIVCKAACGELIVHFDSDDWSAPDRISIQVEMMEREKKSVCGFRRMYFWDTVKEQAWIYNGAANYVLGTSLMFKRSFWVHNLWNEKFRLGSDNVFVNRAWHLKQLTVSQVTNLVVARNHSSNTNPRKYGSNWKKTNRQELPADFFKETICQPAVCATY